MIIYERIMRKWLAVGIKRIPKHEFIRAIVMSRFTKHDVPQILREMKKRRMIKVTKKYVELK